MRHYHHHDSDFAANLRWEQAFSQLRAQQEEKISIMETIPAPETTGACAQPVVSEDADTKPPAP